MFRLLIQHYIFTFLSFCLSKVIKFEIEFENIAKEDLKGEDVVFALSTDSVSDLMALTIANNEQNLPRPLSLSLIHI